MLTLYFAASDLCPHRRYNKDIFMSCRSRGLFLGSVKYSRVHVFLKQQSSRILHVYFQRAGGTLLRLQNASESESCIRITEV